MLKKEGGQEMVGIALILVGLLLFFSLLRFTTVDFADWKFLGSFAPKGVKSEDTQNLIGPIGALIGFVLIALFGAAAYLVAVGTIWLGVVVAWFKSRLGMHTLLGFGSLMLASAALFSVLEVFGSVHFGGWHGGAIGEGLGNFIFKNLLGTWGSAIILFGVYLTSLILLTGWHPVAFVRTSVAASHEFISEWRANREAAAATAPTVPTKKAKRKRSKAAEAPLNTAVSGVEEGGQAVLPLREIPTPHNPLSPPAAPVQGRLQSPPAKSKFLAVNKGGRL